jgi:hypothetical protein
MTSPSSVHLLGVCAPSHFGFSEVQREEPCA